MRIIDTPECCEDAARKPVVGVQEGPAWNYWPQLPSVVKVVKAGDWLSELATTPVAVSDEYYRRARFTAAETKFRFLEKEWRNATAGMSLEQDKIAHIAYLQIIAMGDDALPFIFQQLQNGRRYWFTALEAITGAHPVPHSAGFQEAVSIWLEWSRNH
jgi:hypothetical protein